MKDSSIPIFAYLRRSTNKQEQEESLVQQEDWINHLVSRLHLNAESVQYFSETRSWFENKTRPEWERLVSEIDKSREPCIILVRDISRLSRNPKDSQKIMDRLYGDNKTKRKIEKIYSLDYEKVKEWNGKTDKEEVHRALSWSYYDSLDTKRKSIGGILLKLEDHQFVYAAPKWFDKYRVWQRQILKCNDCMPFIQRAFEMKAEGKTHKEISSFLRRQAGINIGERDLTERLFRNPIYIGEYTEKTTGLHFVGIEFFEKKPPISRVLWDKVQNCLGKKNSNYGEGQEDHIFEWRMKTESWHLFSKYLAKHKHPTYKGRFTNADEGAVFIGIPEWEVISKFMRSIGTMLSLCSRRYSLEMWNAIAVQKEALLREFYGHEDISIEQETDRLAGLFEDYWYETAISQFSEELRNRFLNETKELRMAKEGQIKKLEAEKTKVEADKNNYRRNAYADRLDAEIIKEDLKHYDDRISQIQWQIFELTSDTEMDGYLERIPEILEKTVELASNPIRKAEIGRFREDVKKLLEISTVELTFDNKKELRIKLFDVLDALLRGDKSVLEAPTGVEPVSKALQASA